MYNQGTFSYGPPPIDNNCLSRYCTSFACQIGALAQQYYQALEIGNKCAKPLLLQIEIAEALLEQLCNIDTTTEVCLSQLQISCIIDKLYQALEINPCGC